MKKKILIVVANYYKDISDGLIRSAKGSLKETFDLNDFESAGLDPTRRAEDITLEEWGS